MPATRTIHRAAFCGLLLLASGLLSQTAQAQLYTWKDAAGNSIIKNAPPPWYKENERSRGPRVQVLRNEKVIDDTSWPQERREEGRNQAARLEAARLPIPVPVPPQVPGQAPGAPKAAEGQTPVLSTALRALQALQAIQKQNQ